MKNFVKPLLSHKIYSSNLAFCTALLISFVLSACSVSKINRSKIKTYKEWKSYRWKEIKRSSDDEVNEWVIYSKKEKDSNFLAYKIEGEMAASPKACITAFRNDIYQQAKDDKNKEFPTYDIVKESKESVLIYAIHNEAFPFKDTEMSVAYQFYNTEDGNTGVKWKEAWEDYLLAPSKKLSRVESFRGSWEFSPISSHQSKAINIVRFDPKKMPEWLIKPMVTKFLKEGFEKIRQMTLK